MVKQRGILLSKIYAKRTFNALAPSDEQSEEAIKKLDSNLVYEVTVKQARNYNFLKKYFALIKIGHENTRLENIPSNAYRRLMQIKAGFYKMYSNAKGTYVESDSISFEKMSENEFTELYKAVRQQIVLDIGTTEEEIEKQILERF